MNAHRLLALVAACGLLLSIALYGEGLWATSLDQSSPWMAGLGIAAVLLVLPILILNRMTPRMLKSGAEWMPKWATSSARVLTLLAVAHVVWFAIVARGGAPQIRGGQFVLASRGRILEVLTASEYALLARDELRFMASSLIAFYYWVTMFCWFRGSKNQPDGRRAAQVEDAAPVE